MVKFKNGDYRIPPGHKSEDSITSTIVLTFSRSSFLSDIGTDKQTNDLLSCTVKSGLNLFTEKKLRCWLIRSITSIDNPMILVEGYD